MSEIPDGLRAKAEALTGAGLWSTVDRPEVGVRPAVVTDGPHGLRLAAGGLAEMGLADAVPATCFPPACGLAASWDRDAAGAAGRALGEETRANGVSVVLGPAVNIKRSPLCGRNFEYFSEDPLLAGELAAAHVAGVQSAGVGTSVKHFAANNQETDRMRVSAEVDERTLREIYLAAFERVVTRARPATVMCSYNRINGVPASENHWLLTEVLREEWGFSGLVMSDWGAVTDRVAALAAGLDLAMPGPREDFTAAIVAAVATGALPEAAVDAAVTRVAALRVVDPAARQPFDVDAHHEVARAVAEECVVLLRNEGGVLPLGAARVVVTGPLAEAPRYQGGGSSHVNATRVDSPLAELAALAPAHGASVEYVSPDDVAAAAAAAAAADVVVVFGGLLEADESEGFDRATMDFPADQAALIERLAATGTPVVVVVSHGGAVRLEPWHDSAAAILDAALLGQGGGRALARVLFGDANPSGRLAETIPLRLEDHPSWLNFPGELGQVRYGEGVLVGYRYFATADAAVRYPFGHGLSYTSFAVELVDAAATGPDTASATVRVTNEGPRPGAYVVELYVAPPPGGPVRRPVRELRDFAKVRLAPGETAELAFTLDDRAFAYWDVAHQRWTVAAGDYGIEVGDSCVDIRSARTVTLSGNAPAPHVTLDSSLAEWLAHPAIGPQLSARLIPALGGFDVRMIDSAPMTTLIHMFGVP
ncbi:MAG: glycoside hydrolase family 3 C-terminal domain-containing protein, partial [Propionibacteriaceae bacterium]|nr:glycoside hydrolase family 3 C-terminal domain-containing protein [Propionibacteriaceae bacterium]